MNNGRIITNFSNFTNEADGSNVEVDTKILDVLIELVGSEKDVEICAKSAFKDLRESFEKNEVEVDGKEPADKLAMASLIVKLVESGKLGPEDADTFIEEHLAGSEEEAGDEEEEAEEAGDEEEEEASNKS